jgi:hypothetical protein
MLIDRSITKMLLNERMNMNMNVWTWENILKIFHAISGGIFWIYFTMCGIIFDDVAKYSTTFTKYFATSHGIWKKWGADEV